MADKVFPGPLCNQPSQSFKEAVCIDVDKIYDSCKDKDCMEDMRVYLTRCSQAVLDRAINVRTRDAEIIWVYIDVEQVPFNNGFYTVDIKYFFKVSFEAFVGVGKPNIINGLCTFDKKVILYGSEGSARIYSSKFVPDSLDPQIVSKTNMPKATVEVVDPISLGCKVVEPCSKIHCCCECDVSALPKQVCDCFDDAFYDDDDCKRLYVSLGLFSIVRLERTVQLLIPTYDFCIPEKECKGNPGNPCDLFDKIAFPTDEFFPPRYRDDGKHDCGCK